MIEERIHLSKADVSELEEQFVLRALRSGWIAPLGPDVDAFEAEVAQRVGVRHALAVSSGTAALHLALLHVGAGPGKVVILPSMTFAASANAVMYTGAVPVFVDSQPEDGNVDPAMMLNAVDTLQAEGKNVAAAMTVDLFGRCVDYDKLLEGLRARQIPLVEDAAEALGASYHGRGAGSFGNVGALSFNGNKIMTTSGGGMLLSDDPEAISRARYLATQARQPVPWYEHTEVGYNYRMSNVLAALGRAQLLRLDSFITRRRHVRSLYRNGLEDIAGIRILGDENRGPNKQDNYWLTVLRFDQELNVDTAAITSAFEAENIEVRPVWKPMHMQPHFRTLRSFTNGTSTALFRQAIAVPSGASLRDEQILRVIGKLRELMRGTP